MKFCGLAAFLVLAFSFSYVAEAKGRSRGGSRGGGRKTTSHTVHQPSHTPIHHNTQTHAKDSSTLFLHNEGGGATRPDSRPQPHHVPSAPPSHPSPIGFRQELTNGAGQRPMESPHQIPLAQSPPINQQNYPVNSHIQSPPAPYPVQAGYPGSYPPPNQSPGTIHIHNTYQVPTHPGIPNNGPPPAYGTMAQPSVPAPTIIVQGGSNPSLGQMVKEAAVHSVVHAGVNRLFNGPSHHNSASSSSQNQPAGVNPAVTSNTTIIHNNYYGPQDNGQRLTGSNLANVSQSPAAAPISSASNSTNQNVTATAEPAGANLVNVPQSPATATIPPASNSTNQNVTGTAELAGANLTATNITIIHNVYLPQDHGQGSISPNLVNGPGVATSFKRNSAHQHVIIALPIYLFTHLFIYFYV